MKYIFSYFKQNTYTVDNKKNKNRLNEMVLLRAHKPCLNRCTSLRSNILLIKGKIHTFLNAFIIELTVW